MMWFVLRQAQHERVFSALATLSPFALSLSKGDGMA
jgi:hypothetical protein